MREAKPEAAPATDSERHIRELAASGAAAEAATVALRAFGPELLRFLIHVHRDEVTAEEVFAEVAEDLWRGLPSFRWESSFRTWAYRVARSASSRQRKRGRRRDRLVPLAELGPLSEIVESVRTQTLTALRTEGRSKLDQLREELDVDERVLLVLRIDKGLPWDAVARVLHDGPDAPGPEPRDVARIRKRFQLLKERLKRRGRELGLIPTE